MSFNVRHRFGAGAAVGMGSGFYRSNTNMHRFWLGQQEENAAKAVGNTNSVQSPQNPMGGNNNKVDRPQTPPLPVGAPPGSQYFGGSADGSVHGWTFPDGSQHYFKNGAEMAPTNGETVKPPAGGPPAGTPRPTGTTTPIVNAPTQAVPTVTPLTPLVAPQVVTHPDLGIVTPPPTPAPVAPTPGVQSPDAISRNSPIDPTVAPIVQPTVTAPPVIDTPPGAAPLAPAVAPIAPASPSSPTIDPGTTSSPSGVYALPGGPQPPAVSTPAISPLVAPSAPSAPVADPGVISDPNGVYAMPGGPQPPAVSQPLAPTPVDVPPFDFGPPPVTTISPTMTDPTLGMPIDPLAGPPVDSSGVTALA